MPPARATTGEPVNPWKSIIRGKCMPPSWLTGSDARQAIQALAKDVGVPFHGIWLEVDPERLLSRVAARRNEASDATPEVVSGQLRSDPGPFSKEWKPIDAGGTQAETVGGARAAMGVGKKDFLGPRL